MNTDARVVMSKKLLFASIFGICLIGLAFYTNIHKQSSQDSITNNTHTPQVNNTGTELDLTSIPLNNPSNTDSQLLEGGAGQQLNETDKLTRNILAPYIKKSRAGTYTTDDSSDIVQRATSYMFTIDYTPLTIKEISISPTNDKATIITYKNNLEKALSELFNLKEYELSIYARAIQDNSKEDFDKLSELSTIYKSTGDAVLKIEVPSDLSTVHLEILNSIYKFSVILNELSKGYDDPAASLGGAGNFSKTENEFASAFDNLKLYFTIHDIQ